MSLTKKLNVQIENLTINKIIKYNERIIDEMSNDNKYRSGAQNDRLQSAVREHLIKLRKIKEME